MFQFIGLCFGTLGDCVVSAATLGCLCLLLVANGFQGILLEMHLSLLYLFFCCVAYMNSPVSEDGSLMIIGPEHTQIEADPGNGQTSSPVKQQNLFRRACKYAKDNCFFLPSSGEPLVLHCDVFTKSDMDETLIYWLVNDSFPEDTSSHDRIIESKE